MEFHSTPEQNNNPENNGPELHVEEFEPKWKHTQEDLKYMFDFDISIEHEVDLSTKEMKEKMYERALHDFSYGNPFSLEIGRASSRERV